MTKSEKLLEKALNNPFGLSFNEFQTLLKRSGWRCPKNNAGSIVDGFRPTVKS